MTLRIGILGASRVAVYAMIAAAKDVSGVEVIGIAARDPKRAKEYAEQHSIPNVYADYATLIAADEVDAVYNALPPNLHAMWSIAAVQAGKPVLCEKPFTLNVADAEAMLSAEANTGKLIMEAQHTYYHPRHARIREIVQSGLLGKIQHISSAFDVPIPQNPSEIRWDGAVGGGALWDLGVYPVFWLRVSLGQEPQLVSAAHLLNGSSADIWTDAAFIFPSGATGSISCSMERSFSAWLKIEGDEGALFIDNPLSPNEQTIILNIGGKESVECFTSRATYSFQLEAFRDAISVGGSVHTHGADSLATIKMLSEIRALAKKD
jgi:predicted dehydrogenase